jgi:hypothetical protein
MNKEFMNKNNDITDVSIVRAAEYYMTMFCYLKYIYNSNIIIAI